jgi:outer membrane protein W
MMRKLFFVLFSLGILANGIYGQDSLAYKSKWQTKFLVGMNIPVTKFQGTEFDYLFQYDDYSIYIQPPLAISYFFHKHWGLEATFQIGFYSGIGKKTDKFVAAMQSEYGDKYYVQIAGFNDVEFNRSYLGVIYRLETNKFYVYPKFSIGALAFDKISEVVNLKEKNSNYKYRILYSGGKISDTYFTLAPSVSFGYKLLKRLYLNADIMLSYFKTNMVYKKEFTNSYTEESTVEYFDYKKNIFTLSFGAGLIYVIH